ncbi:MAG TPA: acyl-CoA dehydrogenase family protein [Acidimicrobiales bacterium]|nr:acyl-CoA dehydrogenase family protein [Acidimicrobiales bacterium]
MAWSFATEPEDEKRLDWARDFLRERVYPLETLDLDDAAFRAVTAELQEEVKAAGLFAAHLPPDLGGSGHGQVFLALLNEIVGSSATIGPILFGSQPPDSGNAELIAIAGTDEQQERWMRPLLAGELRSCFSMTEQGRGSDPTLIETRARRDGDEWVIDGQKWFSSNASIADFLIVMCRTNDGPEVHKRFSMLVVPAGAPGLHIRDVPTMQHPYERAPAYAAEGEVTYDGVRVPADHLLGDEGAGFALAQRRLGPGRIHHCMRWIGQCRRAFDMLCERAVSRSVHGSTLGDKQLVQAWVADSYAQIEAARLLTLKAAWTIDTQGVRAAINDISMIKFVGAEVLHAVIDRAIQLHGSLGYSSDMPLEEMYRLARAARIYDGPDEVHRVGVARRILRGYQPRDVPTEHVPTRRAAAVEQYRAHLTE